jgi:hypothetical protein
MRPKTDVLEALSRFITLGTYALCAVVFFAAPLMALSWRQVPFPGFLVDSTLVVNTRASPGWSGREAGLDAPYLITRLAGEPVKNTAEFTAVLQDHRIGETISVFSQHPDGRVELFPAVRLVQFPPQDSLQLFWLPYAVGLAYLLIGVWIFMARGHERQGRALTFFCANVAIVAALLFDVLTTHVATAIWVTAVAMLGGALISLAMRFPVEWRPIHRRPWLLTLPYMVSVALALWGAVSLRISSDPWMYLAARSASYRYAALACLIFFAVMIYRAPQSRDSAVRRQARLVLLGSVIAFTPVIIWFLAPVFGAPLQFSSLAILPVLLIFPFSVAVAITRYRLLEIDAIVNRAIVYAVLTAMLAGLFTAAIALSQRVFVAFTGEESDAAIVITTLIVASAIAPLRTQLQTWVDRQFREVPTGPLRAFGDEVTEFVQLNDPELLAQRFLSEAVGALGAEAGAISRIEDGRPRTVFVHGVWRGTALMSVPLASDGLFFGTVLIGPRRNGRRYRRYEAESLAQVAQGVARAMAIAGAHRAVGGE